MQFLKTLGLTTIASLAASSAFASTFAGECTKEPQAKWPTAASIETKAKQAGYTVAKSKVAGSCYEVYASKDGKRFELFYNPMTGDLVHTAAK